MDVTAAATADRTALAGHEAAVESLLNEYFSLVDGQAQEYFGDELDGLDISEAVASDLDRLSDPELSEPLFVASTPGRVVGAAQAKPLDGNNVEMKRLYVRPEAQGAGIGRALVTTFLDEVAAEGFETVRLGVAPYHERARELYTDLGFEFTEQYEGSNAPEAIVDEWGFMKRTLSDW
jgi:ribosomal protein S18 acetylase RimI-like enzyme